MAETSNIAWTKSTFNPWIGCTKIGPGCDHCYAEAQDSRKRWGGTTHWGADVPRFRTSVSNWRKPLAWNKQAPTSEFAGRIGFWPVFSASLGDVFDNQVPDQWRHDLFDLICKTPNLSWLLVTKRIGNVPKMVSDTVWHALPNVRLMITVVNQEEADRDIPKLLALPCNNGISYEPALGAIDFSRWLNPTGVECMDVCPNRSYVLEDEIKTFKNGREVIPYCPDCGLPAGWTGYDRGIEWIIVGGESSQPGHPARALNIDWARSTVQQCRDAGVPVFVKQLGSRPVSVHPVEFDVAEIQDGLPVHTLKDRAGADPTEWPEDLRVREFPTTNQGV